MKKLALWFTLFCVAVSAAPVGPIASNRRRSGGGLTLIDHGSVGLGVNGGTGLSLNTSGSNFILIAASFFSSTALTASDNKGNAYTPLTRSTNTTYNPSVQLFYCYSPSAGSGHTFTITCTGGYVSIAVVTFSGVAASPFDGENGNNAGITTTIQPGSVTPSQPNALIITSVNMPNVTGTTRSIDSGYTKIESIEGSDGVYYGNDLAYKAITDGSTQNPTWTTSGGVCPVAATIAAFKY